MEMPHFEALSSWKSYKKLGKRGKCMEMWHFSRFRGLAHLDRPEIKPRNRRKSRCEGSLPTAIHVGIRHAIADGHHGLEGQEIPQIRAEIVRKRPNTAGF